MKLIPCEVLHLHFKKLYSKKCEVGNTCFDQSSCEKDLELLTASNTRVVSKMKQTKKNPIWKIHVNLECIKKNNSTAFCTSQTLSVILCSFYMLRGTGKECWKPCYTRNSFVRLWDCMSDLLEDRTVFLISWMPLHDLVLRTLEFPEYLHQSWMNRVRYWNCLIWRHEKSFKYIIYT